MLILTGNCPAILLLFTYYRLSLCNEEAMDDRLADCSDTCRGATKGSGGFDTVSDGLDMPEGM